MGDKIGWCNGDSACENLGPLDYHDENGDTVWNNGVEGTRDLFKLETFESK